MSRYCIMRFSKLKSLTALNMVEFHAKNRDRLVHRKHPEREVKFFNSKYYDKDSTIVQRFKKLTEGIKIRKNAVYALEFIFAFSPEAEGTFDLIEWSKANIRWLKDNFGGSKNIISFRLDMDESTPHNHAVVVPIVEVDGERKLAARKYVNGKIALSKLQTSYVEYMAEFGLERGRSFMAAPELPSKRHKSLAEYWKEADEKLRTEVKRIHDTIFEK